MPCDIQEITCSIDQLRVSLEAFNLNSFLATAVATLLGVLVGAVLSFFIQHRAWKLDLAAAHRREMDEALAKMNASITDLSYRLRTRKVRRWRKADADVEDWPALASIANARALASDVAETEILNRIRELVTAGRGTDVVSRTNNLSYVWRTTIVWREGKSPDEVLSELDDLIRATKQSKTWSLTTST
ncbi:hypothetical protein ACEXQB_012240 [Herbiconiux sp. P18]|uniref:hypothetical protein n=1 Tax=Herbiconiux liangxiaofengii TaxID=3342795 RepID=UPI0035BA54CA